MVYAAKGTAGGAGSDFRAGLPKPVAATLVVSASDSLHPERADYHCDGTADDVEINAALAAINAAGIGGMVELLEGTYTLADPITFPGNNLILMGQGMENTFLDGDGLATGEHAIVISAVSGCAIARLRIQTQDGGGKVCHCIFIEDGANDTHIDLVHIVDSDSDGIHIEGTTMTDVRIHACHIAGADDNGISVNMDGGNACNRLHIDGLIVLSAGLMGISLLECDYGTISNTLVALCTQSGIVIDDGCDHTSILGCTCVFNTQHGILLTTTSVRTVVSGCFASSNGFHGIYLNACNDNEVFGCTCYDNDTGHTNTYDGIYLDNTSTGNNINNNHCSTNDRYGIGVDGARNRIGGNLCEVNGYHGIMVAAADCQIQGNYCYDNSQSAAGTYHGIYLSADAIRCHVDGNKITDPGDATEDGIHLADGAIECMINNNYIYNVMGDGIMLAGNNLDCQIVGNTCSTCDDNGIYVFDESDRCVVTGNKCKSNTLNGILVSESDYCTVTGNVCNANAQDGIHIAGDATHEANYNTVSSNICTGNTQSGIELSEVGAGDCNKTIVIGNQLLGNGAALTDGGTNSEIGHNISV